MTITMKIEGLKEVHDALHELPKATAKNIVRRVLKSRAQLIADYAIQKVPVASGSLRKSIVVSTKLTKRQKGLHKKFGPDDIDVFVGPGSNPQAVMQEFGTSNHPAQPFMRPAWDAVRGDIVNNLAEDMWVEIEKAVARIARKAAKAGS